MPPTCPSGRPPQGWDRASPTAAGAAARRPRVGNRSAAARRRSASANRFWNQFSADPTRFSGASREHYARLYARPGAMRAGFAQFVAFDRDARDNQTFLAEGKLAMPVLAVGGEKSFGPTMTAVMRFAATDVQEPVIPDAGHWLMEEQPAATVAAVRDFLDPLR